MTDNHSASRRADVLAEEAPHLIADPPVPLLRGWCGYPGCILRTIHTHSAASDHHLSCGLLNGRPYCTCVQAGRAF